MLRYTVKRSSRKTVSIRVKDGEVTVLSPHGVTDEALRGIVEKHRRWIEKRLSEHTAAEPPLTEAELRVLYDAAKRVIPARVAHFAPIVGVSYGRVTIRSQKTRWGSCSSTGNLNFNCLLVLLPDEIIDSVIVHELCHRKQMNHSDKFYAEIDKVFPDYKRCREELKRNGNKYINRIPKQTERR